MAFKKGGRNSNWSNRKGGFNKFDKTRDRRSIQMHAAVCAQCSGACEVPFKPFPGQEVLCNNCFSKDGVNANSKSFSRNNAPRINTQAEVPQVLKLELNQIHSKIDKILSIVQKMIAQENPVSKEEAEEIQEEVTKIKKSFTPKIFKKKK